MLKWGASAFAAVVVWATASAAGAAETGWMSLFDRSRPSVARVYGQALPPVGFVNFCSRHETECRSLGGTRFQVQLDGQRWEQLNHVNRFVNASVKPETDQDIYKQAEFWDYPKPEGAGDCEDYVLLKKRYLEGLGFPAESLLITVVLDEAGEGHAVLMAKTDRGDLVLDNRRDNILLWNDTKYEFLKRQSQDDPQIWVALTNKRRGETTIAGGN